MIAKPVEGGVAEDEVERAEGGIEIGDVARDKRQVRAGMADGPREHRRRLVQTDGGGAPEDIMHDPGQFAGATSEVDGTHARQRFHQ